MTTQGVTPVGADVGSGARPRAPWSRARLIAAGRAAPTWAACFGCGAAAAYVNQPWGVLPGLLGYAGMFRLVDRGRGGGQTFARGWLSGAGYFLVSLWWIANPFFVDAKDQGWMAPLAVPLVTAGMALFWGLASLLYRLVAAHTGAARVLAFAAALAAAEWLRGHVLTGFPWDLPGETWKAGSAPSQVAAFVGAYGLTWITLVGAAAPGLIDEGRKGALAALAGVGLILSLYAAGAARLASAPPRPPAGGAPTIRVVQAGIPEAVKYDPAWFPTIVDRYVTLTRRPSGAALPQIVVWSEGAIPAPLEDYLAPGTWTEAAIADALSPGQVLILGGYRLVPHPNGELTAFNSLELLKRRPDGLALETFYDKHRLVPFGEYMPLAPLARTLGIEQLVHVGDGFEAGPPPRPRRAAGAPPFQPLICYESLFPGFAHAGERAAGYRPAWIVNISNDSWFGTGMGPAQLLNLAAYRAIEEGLPMVRATPTGYSAVIDAYGRIAPGQRLGQGAAGVIDAPLPPPLPPTLYARWGEGPFFAMLALSLVGLRWRRRERG
ncbi:MAG TPA: apolipoprotein N-acyltransferase [Caulobacteraceae bacterium]|nr:apolipoprotein N-acyltransferase [Caulobacteraceae bacterium]